MLSAVTIKSIGKNLLLILALPVFFSCQKEISLENSGTAVQPPPDLSTKIKSSVSGSVVDENDAPVTNATVQFGNSTVTTDKYGYFSVKNVDVVKTAATVTISRPGYLSVTKTYTAKEGKAAFFRVKLMPLNTVGSFTASSGGTVSLSNNLKVSLPANAVVNAASNTTYSGTVNVTAYWLNPAATDFAKQFPGDFRGLDNNNKLSLLQAYGIAAIELRGTAGELLQVASGKKATITIPIPAASSATAPSSIPLWYFDAATGLWKEDGSATKNGNIYTGDVTHFSWWIAGLPGPYVFMDLTLQDLSGNSLRQAFVRVKLANNNNWEVSYGWTDENGFVSGNIPANQQLILDVFNNYGCTVPVPPLHTQNFTTTSTNISLGTIQISVQNNPVITGTLLDCNNIPVANGFIIIRSGVYNLFRFPVTNGNFTIPLMLCVNNYFSLQIEGQNAATQEGSVLMPFQPVAGINNLGNIVACGNNVNEFMNYSINGTNYSYNYPADYFYQSIYTQPPLTSNMMIQSYKFPNYEGGIAMFDDQNIAAGSTQAFYSFHCTQITDSIHNLAPINVHITEYGAVGQFVAGNFSGTLTGAFPPYNTYIITCNFRVRRFM